MATPWRWATGTGRQAGWHRGAEGAAAWLALHGGPGSGASAGLLAPFDALGQQAWGPHQRGTLAAGGGRVQRLSVNTLVADLEALRQALGLARWSVLGGSWGGYLALAYLARHPQAVAQVVLRGCFLATRDEVWQLLQALPCPALQAPGLPWPSRRAQVLPWLRWAQGVLRFGAGTPQARRLVQAWLLAEGHSALRGAARTLRHATLPGPAVPAPALRAAWRGLHHGTRRADVACRTARRPGAGALQKVRVQARMLQRLLAQGGGVWGPRALPVWRQWVAQGGRVQILHGRQDGVCPPRNARRLQQALGAGAALQWVDSGHLATEPGMAAALRRAVRRPA